MWWIILPIGALGFYFWNREREADEDWIRLNQQNPVAATALNSVITGQITNPAVVATAIVQLRQGGFDALADKLERSSST